MSNTQLITISNRDNTNYEGDIIFVHGLGGDARGAWHPTGKRDDYDFWPTWLGEDLPNLRVWTLDYAIEPFHWKGETMPLVDRATDVLACLDIDVGKRPIFFITHSMGGLLVKQMLRHAWDFGNSRWKAIAEQTKGIIYLSTPHSGSDLANWVNYMGAILQASVSVEELKAHDPRLRELNQVYRNHDFLKQIPIEVYCEKRKTKGILVVNETSVDPGIPGVIPIPMDEDHNSICRPQSKQSNLYRRTKRFIIEQLASSSLQSLPKLKESKDKTTYLNTIVNQAGRDINIKEQHNTF
ncbi:alpha/beta fold hydrolase [Spirulina sp. CS-785/01]|uniref:esterase/lipase family protein n=1 Tax=Spirulina sp. CS-785/01 TaxID=3021716 RepID=UPI00232D987A|nr:alpha/beta fold hydrolase [Spirulina sp. CS-785/01]MDB9312087.1 alpha/beta fold hydrolase [Spirulina sp. CS-785/01]